MHLSLEVLASASIKRKKPWPQLTWVGKEKESLVLMDQRRLSLLYLPSGKTRRKINKVNKMLPNTLCMNISRNGSYLAGFLATGEVFVWHKDTDLLRTTAPLPMEENNPQTSSGASSRRHHIFISNEGGKILVVQKDGKVHVWQKDDHSSSSASPQKSTGKVTELSGRWYEVGGGTAQLPGRNCKEVAVDAVFSQDMVQGTCCTCSFVFNSGKMFTISTAFLHWHERADVLAFGPVPFSVTWKVSQRPLADSDSTPIRSKGVYLASYTNDGQVLAVACNRGQPKDTKVLFVSVSTSTAVEANMKSCGAKTDDLPPKILRTYWICGMRWTCDDLFLVCITKRGSVVILTRLGEPLTLTTHGCSVEMGPSLYLPLHPLIIYSPGQENIHPSKAISQSPPSSTSDIDPLRQRFSVATHPFLPIILCSDGYMVTVMQLPSELTTPNVLKSLCAEANLALSNLGVQPDLGSTLTKVLGQSGGVDKKKGVTQWRNIAAGLKMSDTNRTDETNSFSQSVGNKKPSATVKKGPLPWYTFEEPTDSGDLSQSESDVSTIGQSVRKAGLASADEGKIFFGDQDLAMDTVVRPEKAKTPTERAESLSTILLCAWGLSLSYSGQWTWELEVITRHIVDCLVKLVSHLLQAKEVKQDKRKGKPKKEHLGVARALVLFRNAMNMVDWDAAHHHCLPCVVRLVDGVTGQLLGRVRGQDIRVRGQLETLSGCQHLLRFAEERLNRAYRWNSGKDGRLQQGSEGSERHAGSGPWCKMQGTPGKKLAKCWKLLYNMTLRHYLSLKTAGSVKPSERWTTLALLGQLQHQLQTLGCSIARNKRAAPDPTNQMLLGGSSLQALDQWEARLRSLQDNPETPHSVAMETITLLSILYTHLLQYNLGAALLLVQSLIDSWNGESSTNQEPSRFSCHLSVDGGGDVQEGLGVLRKSARPVVRSFARFMAAYFSNEQLCVYPPHAARPLSPVHLRKETGPRTIPLHHSGVSSAVRRQSLSDVWTANFTMELLLLCGQAPETVWLANQLGDWKGALMLAVSYLDFLNTVPATAKLHWSLQLPESLQPLALLQGRLMSFLSNSPGGAENSHVTMEGTSHTIKRTASTGSLNLDEDSSTDQVCRSLQDLFTAATVAGAEAVPWLLEKVVCQMQQVCSRLTTEVPAGLYLPAPPLYLPQPTSTSEDYVCPEVRHEKDLRRQVAHLTQLALVLLQAAGCQLPCARWYLQQLLQARQLDNKKIKKLPSNTQIEMPEGLATLLATGQDFRTLHSTSQPQGSLSKPSHSQDTLPEPALRVVAAFRQLCGLLWLLEARERLSLCGRKLQTLREMAFQKPSDNDTEELEFCETALGWALSMLPFADYLDAEDDLQDIVLSLVGELPMTRRTGDILADHFYDPELLSPTVEDKWNHLQARMRKTRIAVDQPTEQEGATLTENRQKSSKKAKDEGKTLMLSVYTHKKSSKRKKEIDKKARVYGSYETQVFNSASSDKNVCVGSWPFETEDSYLFFLETFFSVVFEKAKQEEKGEKVPLLGPYKLEVREREVNSIAHKAILSFQQKSLVVKAAMSFLGEASHKEDESKQLGKESLSQSLSSVMAEKVGRRSLFKSRSATDVSESKNVTITNVSNITAGGDGGKSPEKSLAQRRAASLSDLGKERSPKRSWVSMTELRPKVMNLGGKFDELTPLVEWLHRWSCRKNMMSPGVKDGTVPGGGGAGDSKAVIRVRVPPSLVLTSFWLMENVYFRKQLSTQQLAPPQEYVVYPTFSGRDPNQSERQDMQESEHREQTAASSVDQGSTEDSREQMSSGQNKGRKGRKQPRVQNQGAHETSSEGISTEEAGKVSRRPRMNKQQQTAQSPASKRGKSPIRVHASIPRHVLESPTEVSSSSWTPVLSSDSQTEDKAVPPPASMTSVTSMSPPKVEPRKKLSFTSQPSTVSPEETIKSEDSSTFNISSLASDESQATPTGLPITIPTPGSHLARERPVASSTPHSAFVGQRSGQQQQTSVEKQPKRTAQDETVVPGRGQVGSKGRGQVMSTNGAPVPSRSSSVPGFSVPKQGGTVAGSPRSSSSIEEAVNNVKEMRQLVRSELRSILEIQHQNIVSMLNTSGTVNVVVGKSEHNPGPPQGNTADRQTQVSQDLQVTHLEQIAAQVSPAAPASGVQVRIGQQSAHNPGNPSAQPPVEASIHNTRGESQPNIPSFPLLRFPGFPDYNHNPVASTNAQSTHEPSTNLYQNSAMFGNAHHSQNVNPFDSGGMTRPHNTGRNPGFGLPGTSLHPQDNPGHNPGFAHPGSSLHPPGMPLLRLPPELPTQRPVPFEAWGYNSRPVAPQNHNVQDPQDGRTDWPGHLNLEQYDSDLVNSVSGKGGKKDRGPLLLASRSKPKESYNKPFPNPTPPQESSTGYTEAPNAGVPGVFTPAMPLLHLDNSFAPSQMMRGMYRMPPPQHSYPQHQFPTFPQPSIPSAPRGPNPNVEDVEIRLPLLHLRDEPQTPSYQYNFAPSMPRLVPPEDIIAYEQKKQQTEVLKIHRRHRRKEEEDAARRQENLPLLQADIEPWDPKGDRENLKRQRRRLKKDSGVSQGEEKMTKVEEEEDKVSATGEEDIPSHDENITPGVIIVQPSPAPNRTTPHRAEVQDRQDTDTAMPRDQGYVIEPGTFDDYLEYQTVVPTPAQIHYDAVINKKAKPVMKTTDTQTDKPSTEEEHDVQTVQTEPERAKTQTTAEKETNTVIVVSRDVYSAEQVVSQYAATGMDVSRGGPGLPPDIFFNLRFGKEATQATDSSAGLAPSHRQDQEVQTPAFLNVVDIDASLMKDLKPTKQPRQRTPPGAEETVEEERSPPATGLPDDATPADIHYRLAGLTNSVKPAEVDDEGNIQEPPAGDSLTVDLLSSITGESPVNLTRIRRDTAGVRAKSRERLADKLVEMGRQLDAIDQMANNMEDDFKNTRLLVSTIDNLGEAIHPEMGGDEEDAVARRPSGRGRQFDSRRHDTYIPPATVEEHEKLETPVRDKQLPSPILEEDEDAVKAEEGGVVKDDRPDQEPTPTPAPAQADRNLERLLDMTGLSGVSDIIAEVFADGGLQEEDLNITGAEPVRDRLPPEPFTSSQLSVDTLQEVFSPRAQDSSREEEEKKAKRRKGVQKWMQEKRAERRSEYLKQLEDLRSTEHRPYKPAQDSPKQGATWKQIHQAEKQMEDRRKTQLKENMSERVKQAYDLMGDIVIDTPELPASSLPPPSTKKKKPARPGSSARGSSPLHKGLPKSSTPIPRSWQTQDSSFDVDELLVDSDPYIQELLQDAGVAQGDMLQTYKVRDVSKIGEESVTQGGRRPKPFTKLVRQQRPEAARSQPTGKPQTYTDRLADANASKIPRPTFNKLKDKQRLYATGGRTDRNRMQEVTRRGLHSEPKPRKYASTYAQRLQSQQPDTARRGGRVSPRQPVGKRFEGPRHKPKTYAQQLQDISAAAPKGRPRLAYTGTSARGLKSPAMRTQTLRHAPYPDVYESVLEDISEASTTSLLRSTSDDVRRILEEEDVFGDGGASPKQRDYLDFETASLDDVGDDVLGDDYINTVDPEQLSQASQSTGSILSNINWDEVEQLIATVE